MYSLCVFIKLTCGGRCLSLRGGGDIYSLLILLVSFLLGVSLTPATASSLMDSSSVISILRVFLGVLFFGVTVFGVDISLSGLFSFFGVFFILKGGTERLFSPVYFLFLGVRSSLADLSASMKSSGIFYLFLSF